MKRWEPNFCPAHYHQQKLPSPVKGRERMKRWFWSVCAGASLMAGVALAQPPAVMRIKAPELREVTEWINTKPLTLAELQGKVVVLHFWTFG